MYKKDLTGKRYGKLVVEKYLRTENGKSYWLCRCDCGNYCEAFTGMLNSGIKKSCGCLKIDRAKEVRHGDAIKGSEYNNLYKVWGTMKRRCSTDKEDSYRNYGARGISVCDEWMNDYAKFKEWAIKSGYKKGLTIDRIDVNGNYCPENCRWLTKKQQSRNKRGTVYVEYGGKKISLQDLCEAKKSM